MAGLIPDGAHLGLGVFETMRARLVGERPAIIGLSLHLKRLRNGLKEIGASDIDEGELLGVLREALRPFDWESHADCLVRLIGYRSEWLLAVAPWQPSIDLARGASAVTVVAERPRPELKSCSALVSVLAREEASRRGADEAILVSASGEVTEGAWSNLFSLDRDGVLSTPSERVLPGITREIVCGLSTNVRQRIVRLEEILSAREVFLTQATHGIIPLVSIDGRTIGEGTPGPLTTEIRSRYEALCRESAIDVRVLESLK